jgi:tetraspanin-13/31
MLILFLLFLVQFSVACACLAFNAEQQHQLAEQVLSVIDEKIKYWVSAVNRTSQFVILSFRAI